MATIDLKPGTRFTLAYEIVRPVNKTEFWKDEEGKTFLVDNKRGQLFFVKSLDSENSSLILFCMDEYSCSDECFKRGDQLPK